MTRRSEKSIAQRIALIRRGRGCLKRKPGEKPFSEWWAQQKAEEREMEDLKILRPAKSENGSK